MQAVIRDAGGTGDFKTVVLGHVGLRGALRGAGRLHRAVRGLGGHRGASCADEPLKTFAYADYGFPDAYSVLLIGNSPWLAAHPDAAAAFVQAAQRGYQLAADDPGAGAPSC